MKVHLTILFLCPAAGKESKYWPWILPHYIASRQKGPGNCALHNHLGVQAKAMGHQGSPLTEATSGGWVKLTLVYRLSCPGYFTVPEPGPSPELDSTDELTCRVTRRIINPNWGLKADASFVKDAATQIPFALQKWKKATTEEMWSSYCCNLMVTQFSHHHKVTIGHNNLF